MLQNWSFANSAGDAYGFDSNTSPHPAHVFDGRGPAVRRAATAQARSQ